MPRKKITILVKDKHKYEKTRTFGQSFKRYGKTYCYAYDKKKTLSMFFNEPVNPRKR